jgi:LysM repeat protein
MVSNQALVARLLAGLLIAGAGLSGCAHFHHSQNAAPAAQAPADAPATASADTATAAPAPPQMTATEAAIANQGNAPAASPGVDASEIQANAPMHYTVKKGDTLWGIASMYLKDPWLWPEVWIINPQVANPHLIYPGDQLALAYGADGHVHVALEAPGVVRLDPRLRSAPLEGSIPNIPYSTIAAFLSRPTVMSSDEVKGAPYVLAFRDMHNAGGNGNEVYVRNLPTGPNARYAVMHIAGPLVDPDDGKTVGYEGIYTATALVQRPGDPAKAVLIDPARETLRGDRLLGNDTHEPPANFLPHAPTSGDVRGTIIDVVAGDELVGTYNVIVVNRGRRNGIDPGTVLAIDQAGDEVRDLFRNGREIGNTTPFAPKVRLPEERSGTVLVFRVFDRVSFGLVIGAADLIRVGDIVRTP